MKISVENRVGRCYHKTKYLVRKRALTMAIFSNLLKRRGYLVSTIAQILLAFLILPLICLVISLIPGGLANAAINLFSEIPFMEYWLDFLGKFVDASASIPDPVTIASAGVSF